MIGLFVLSTLGLLFAFIALKPLILPAQIEIVVSVCSSIFLHPISTNYAFGYRRVSVFQRN